MDVTAKQIRGFRLRAHHLDQKLPAGAVVEAAGACGMQNSPPGAWETAMMNRLEGCTLPRLWDALYQEKSLLQAWSFRGAPVVFPTGQSEVFLTPLIAQNGEDPWVYTLGISGALDYLEMPFDDLLGRLKEVIGYLDTHTVKSKEELDRTLAGLIEPGLPQEKQALWRAPSMYGSPGKQTVGGAVVSFLLRPCSFSSLVVFGRREGIHPTFTSYQNWVGRPPLPLPDGEKELVHKFLRAYGPATLNSFASWLGCSQKQARRLWDTIADELAPVSAEGKTCFLLATEEKILACSQPDEDQLLLLGPHDPYLDIRDRGILLEGKSLQKEVWKTVANPGVILKGGRVAGIWRTKTLKDKLDVSMVLFEPMSSQERKKLNALAQEYAAFRQIKLRNCTIEG